ncbi:CDGSH iron-sulfur domain-containing protein [Pseudarthrobacter sp902506025]|uniref:CDGSH-type Zn-finger protein n=2 Tax=Micrococcales TaxID=85006 RepID=A0ABT9UL84_9MICC|nr:CDGSH iron-sulfur domain-containing protein [Pseudarthrobacter defluvii]MDQ0120012.1 CDGSH-type Zn-finger protein [Pseudarthrobacter defluvii]
MTGWRQAYDDSAKPQRLGAEETGNNNECGAGMNFEQHGTRPDVEQEPAPGSIVVCPDGPLIVRGDFEIVTPSGDAVPRERRTVALCRCGASAIKPYCDGTHKMIKFRTEPKAGQPPA